jgi:hypothetical protein
MARPGKLVRYHPAAARTEMHVGRQCQRLGSRRNSLEPESSEALDRWTIAAGAVRESVVLD